LAGLPFHHIPRPMFPFDPEAELRPDDLQEGENANL